LRRSGGDGFGEGHQHPPAKRKAASTGPESACRAAPLPGATLAGWPLPPSPALDDGNVYETRATLPKPKLRDFVLQRKKNLRRCSILAFLILPVAAGDGEGEQRSWWRGSQPKAPPPRSAVPLPIRFADREESDLAI